MPPEGEIKVRAVHGEPASRLPYGRLHAFLGALPAAMHPHPADVAIVGLGTGDTAWAAGFRDATRRLVVYEIVARDTIEEVVKRTLRNKDKTQTALLDALQEYRR